MHFLNFRAPFFLFTVTIFVEKILFKWRLMFQFNIFFYWYNTKLYLFLFIYQIFNKRKQQQQTTKICKNKTQSTMCNTLVVVVFQMSFDEHRDNYFFVLIFTPLCDSIWVSNFTWFSLHICILFIYLFLLPIFRFYRCLWWFYGWSCFYFTFIILKSITLLFLLLPILINSSYFRVSIQFTQTLCFRC